ncbi:MAG TPA: STAS domain-containing protein [Chthoniobacteraceae bacterium]|nr:STAS domain-containing protein [Chthoniobacteraceae bacterium]
MSTTSSVLVGCIERTVWVKVEGRGTFQNSAGLKEFVKQMIQRGFRDFVVDLRECEQMDSTFMGTLAGVALRLREIGQGGLRVVNVNERNTGLLSSLGLDQLFAVEPASFGGAEVPDESRLKEAVPAKTGVEEQKKMVLEAHEALVEAESANAVKFKDVLDYMRQELNVPDTEKDG